MSEVYDKVNEAFKKTSRILFKQEIGELKEFEEYFRETMFPVDLRKSFISGKEVMTTPYYPKDARIVSQDELGQVEFAPVDVNKIKDIDSLLEAVGENVMFSGNRMFGKNIGVERGDCITDCVNVYEGHNVWRAKNAAYASMHRESESTFGVSGYPEAKFCIRALWGLGITRCFETYYTNYSSDCYFSFNNTGCSETMFSFNLRNKSHAIGNRELPKDKYLELKWKLAGEIAEKLRKDKRMVSVVDIPRAYGGIKENAAEYLEPKSGKERKAEKINRAFASAAKVVLGMELGPITDYEGWLCRGDVLVRVVEGGLGSETYLNGFVPMLRKTPLERLVNEKEALVLGREKKVPVRDYDLEGILGEAAKIAYFTHEYTVGECADNYDTPGKYGAVDNYGMVESTYSRHCGCTVMAVRNCEYVFGGKIRMLQSRFCINCYDSTELTNCFETDASNSSTGCYFCHNVENVDEGIFCFNVKGKRYAVGNTEVGREEFLRVKKILLDYVVGELEEKKKCELGIFNIPKGGKREGVVQRDVGCI
jgi:predicted metal-binding transcription factor (methanogenesis marker protein 9)